MAQPSKADATHISASSLKIEELLDSMDGHIHGPIDGCIPMGRESGVSERAVRGIVNRYSSSTATPSVKTFLWWFASLSSEELDGAQGVWHTSYHPSSGLEISGSARLFLTHSSNFDITAKSGWPDVQVIGQICGEGFYSNRDGLVSLYGLAQEVFATQPTRLFLHGLYIRGSLIERWIFDRSGMYCCETIKTQDDLPHFFSLVLKYRLLPGNDLGESDIVKKGDTGRFIDIADIATSAVGQLYLEDKPIALAKEVFGEGTTCYRAKKLESDRWNFVVKFKWRLATERPEEELLKLANEKNVWGIVSLDYHKDIGRTAKLRQQLQCGPYRRFTTQRADSAKGVLGHTQETSTLFEDRIFTCVVTSPAGRPLRTFRTMLELLQVLRDAIKAHRSLFQDAQILHQDVSAQNIIIVDSPGQQGSRGIMIDLDVAQNLAEGPRTPGEVTGTRPFMSIGILRRRRHTYRHDLESFLYVFLWTVISNGAENPPRTSALRQWNQGTWDESAMRKTQDMTDTNFGRILAEFNPEHQLLKPVAETMRQLLFPIKDEALWTGTDSSPKAVNELYDGIIGAFEVAISQQKILKISMPPTDTY